MKLPEIIGKISAFTTVIIFALSVFSLFGRYSYIELTTHFRIHYVLAAVVCIIILSFFGFWKLVPLAVLTAAFNLYFIIPYYSAAPIEDVAPVSKLRLMLANVQGNNRNYGGLIEAVKSNNPDVLVLQELTEEWWANVQSLSADYPFYKAVPRSGGSGLVIFSRYPIESAEVLTLDDSTHPAIVSVLNVEGVLLTVFTMHPPTPVTTRKFNYRNGQYAQAAALMRAAPEPKLLVGDLNTTMWSPYYTDLLKDSGLRDPRIGRGIYPSWHTVLPPFLGIPIDHCLVSEKIAIENLKTGDNTGSDHRPLIVDLRIEKS